MSTVGGAKPSGGIEAIESIGKTLAVDPGGATAVGITPTVSSTSLVTKNLDAGSSQVVIGFRATVGSGDDVIASERLANIFPATAQANLDSTLVFKMSSAVTRLDVVGVGDVTAGGCMDTAGTAANALAQMTTFDFATAVSKIVVNITGSWNSTREAQITVEGYAYD